MSDVQVLRALSTIALVVGVVGLIAGLDFAWFALIASGAFWVAELALVLTRRRGASDA